MNNARVLAPFAIVMAIAAPSSARAQIVPAGLICLNRDAQVCDAVNELQLLVNAEAGATVITQSSPATRFRPTSLYNRLLQVKNAAVAGGCTIDGYAGGIYDATAGGSETWSGALETLDGLDSYDADGVCVLSPNEWSGLADDGVTQLDIGDIVGLHNAAGQIAGNVDFTGFKAGYWLRQVGNQGVFVALTGTCPNGPVAIDAGDALDPWWDGALPSFLLPTETVTVKLAVDNRYRVFMDGVQIGARDTNGTWQTEGVFSVNLVPGPHTVAIRGWDEGGPQMAIARVFDDQNATLAATDTTWRALSFATEAAAEPASWQTPGFDDSTWINATNCDALRSTWESQIDDDLSGGLNNTPDPLAAYVWGLNGCSSGSTNNVKTLFRKTFVVPSTP